MNYKNFNIKEANNLIPWITSSFEKIKKSQVELNLINHKHVKLKEKVSGNGFKNHANEFLLLESKSKKEQEKIKAILEMFSNEGIIIRNINLGIIDFPSISDGNHIFLCWKIGEKRLKYWHLQSEGFGNRKLL